MYGDCEHGGDPLACPVCTRERAPAGPRARTSIRTSRPFAAKYDGVCGAPACGDEISAGEMIVMRWDEGDDDSRRAVHYPECAR